MSEKIVNYAEVFPHNGTWCVRFTSEPERSRIQRLFGTNELPTPFTTEYSFSEVHALLKGNFAGVALVEARPLFDPKAALTFEVQRAKGVL